MKNEKQEGGPPTSGRWRRRTRRLVFDSALRAQGIFPFTLTLSPGIPGAREFCLRIKFPTMTRMIRPRRGPIMVNGNFRARRVTGLVAKLDALFVVSRNDQ